MVFSSTIFLFLFLPIVLIVYYNPFFKNRQFRNAFLLLASLVFYSWGEPIFVFLMILLIIFTWICGLKMGSKYKKSILVIGIICNVSILFVFKYLTFLVSEFGLLLDKDFSFINITLPIGISFFTFQLMSYLFDIYYGKAQPQKNPLYVALYVSMFPQLIAGPIIRYEEIEQEIVERHESLEDITEGMQRFICGLGKKVLIADYVAQIADNCFDYLSNMSSMMAWLGAIAYTLQIYFDFSGYSDMAIGLGRMFGFHFSENFNYPYVSQSVTEFWRRWHISLSGWFRDYIYIPLGGNRVKKLRWVCNMFIVWILTGVWHGANWTFWIWGLFYFLVLVFEKQTNISEKLGGFSHIYTLLIIIFAWVIFRANNIQIAFNYIGLMFGVNASGIVDSAFWSYLWNTKFILIVAILGATPFVKKVFGRLENSRGNWIEPVWYGIVFVVSIIRVVSATYNPFIYFNF